MRMLAYVMIAALVWTASAQAQMAAKPEAQLLTKLHMVNEMEIQAGELAQQKGQSPEIREFGRHLAEAHRDADERVQNVAREHQITLSEPSETSKQDAAKRDVMAKLHQAEGREFDRVFSAAMVDGHQRTITDLNRAQLNVTNGDVKDLVRETLPVLQDHYERAVKLQTSTKR